MPVKYPEGSVSPSGKFVVRGGQWAPVEETSVSPEMAGSSPEPESGTPGPGDPAFYGDPKDFESIRQAGMHRGTAAAAGPTVAILGTAATMGGASAAAGAAGRAIPFAKPVAKIAKDLVIAQGVEEAAKATGIPGASAVAEVMLGGKAIKSGAPGLLKRAFEAFTSGKAAKAAATTVAKEAAPAAAKAVGKVVGASVPAEGVKAATYSFALKNGSGAKLGEKIWMLLDDAGAPLRVLSPDAAAAAKRAGRATTWVKKTWK